MKKDVYIQRFKDDMPKNIMQKSVILIPPFYKGITSSKKGFPKKYILLGFDTETYNGEPLCFQFSSGEGPETKLFFTDSKNITEKITSCLKKMSLSSGINTAFIFAHNLEFDLEIALFPHKWLFVKNNQFEYWDKKNRCKWSVKCNNLFFTTLSFYKYKKVKKRFIFIDSTAFFRKGEHGIMSLDAVSKLLKLSKKLKKPEQLGSKKFTQKDLYFIEYAKRDALISYEIGKYLMESFKEFDVQPCVSIAQFAQRIIQKKFLSKIKRIKLPPLPALKASILAYHGGRSGYYVDGIKELDDVTEIDINSMYPYQAKNLFPWTSGSFRKVYSLDNQHPGVYCVTGFAKNCKYPCLYSHDFKPLKGFFMDVWISSYEIMEALRAEELTLGVDSIKEGYVFIPQKGSINPLAGFVDYFYKLKKESKNEKKEIYKLILNSGCYGKFVQNTDFSMSYEFEAEIKKESISETESYFRIKSLNIKPKFFKSGGLFHPFIAMQITAKARIMLHQLEHKYNALDSSTDSIKTLQKIDIKDLGPEIGKVSIKIRSPCIMFRSKMYLFVSSFNQNAKILKAALHGFEGSPSKLLEMHQNREVEYEYSRMTKLRESEIRGLKPFVMRNQKAILDLRWEKGGFSPKQFILGERRGVLKDDLPIDRNLEDAQDSLDKKCFIDSTLTRKEQKEDLKRHTHPTLKDYFGGGEIL